MNNEPSANSDNSVGRALACGSKIIGRKRLMMQEWPDEHTPDPHSKYKFVLGGPEIDSQCVCAVCVMLKGIQADSS